MKKILLPILFAGFFFLGIWITNKFLNPGGPREYIESDSTVILEKIDQVCKLVTIEGNFEERYDEKNIKAFTVYLPLPSTWEFSKSARLRITGTVLVGYDLEELEITADSTERIIELANFPDPQILAIDHEVFYENLNESWFNSFDEEDFTALNANAKKVLEQKAIENHLLEKAREEGNQIIDAIRFMANSAGWEIRIVKRKSPFPATDLIN